LSHERHSSEKFSGRLPRSSRRRCRGQPAGSWGRRYHQVWTGFNGTATRHHQVPGSSDREWRVLLALEDSPAVRAIQATNPSAGSCALARSSASRPRLCWAARGRPPSEWQRRAGCPPLPLVPP